MPKALVIEDEYLIAMDNQLMFEELGWREVHIAANEAEALALSAQHYFRVATLDVHLGVGSDAEKLASHFDGQGTAVIVSTAELPSTLPEVLQLRPYIGKPSTTDDLRRALCFFWPDSQGAPT